MKNKMSIFDYMERFYQIIQGENKNTEKWSKYVFLGLTRMDTLTIESNQSNDDWYDEVKINVNIQMY
jgi:hypothetical protein